MEVQWLAGQRQVRLADRLGLSWVRVDELGYVGRERFPVVDQLTLGDELARPRAHQVDAEYGTAAASRNHFRRALRLQDDALAVAAEVVIDLVDFDSPLGGLGRGDPDRGHLRVAVGNPRHTLVVDRRHRQPGEPLGDANAFGEADVRQLGSGRQVADRRDRRDVGPPQLVDEHEPALHRHSGLFVAESSRDRSAADGDEHQFGFDGLAVLQRDLHPVGGLLHLGELDAQVRVDTAAPKGPLEQPRAGLILRRQQMRQHLDNRDFGAEGTPDARELDSDHAAAKDHGRGGYMLELERVVAGDDFDAVDLQAGQAARLRTGCEHHVGAFVDVVADSDLGRGNQATVAVHNLDFAPG